MNKDQQKQKEQPPYRQENEAMALRFVASLDDYIYKAGEQHRQKEFQAERDAYYKSGGIHPCYD